MHDKTGFYRHKRRKMKRTFIIGCLAVVFLDQVTKYIIRSSMEIFSSIAVIKDVFKITYIENNGIAFGLMGGSDNPVKKWFLIAVVLFAIVMITVYWIVNMKDSFLFNLSCGFIVGGAIGNLIDRILRGSVTDFIEIGYKDLTWPVFNMADTFVTIGIFLFAVYFLFFESKKDASHPV